MNQATARSESGTPPPSPSSISSTLLTTTPATFFPLHGSPTTSSSRTRSSDQRVDTVGRRSRRAGSLRDVRIRAFRCVSYRPLQTLLTSSFIRSGSTSLRPSTFLPSPPTARALPSLGTSPPPQPPTSPISPPPPHPSSKLPTNSSTRSPTPTRCAQGRSGGGTA